MTATFVLVPGMCHGAWSFETLTGPLRLLGHRVHALTLTGVAERAHLLASTVNLDTHIEDVAGVLEAEDIENAVLVGHSYGGMVITGVGDRLPERVDSLVYLDALVPQDGDSLFDLIPAEPDWHRTVGETGYTIPPLPFFDRRTTPHPLASALQRIRLSGDLDRFRSRTYVYATESEWGGPSPFTALYERLRTDPRWTTHALAGKHDLMRDVPEELLTILLESAPA
ncbi:alpha/beta fold hydrolase [Streptomyces syringium]|uniref:Pimeloyl-ACP methyl ester carboxylesterase n=1 Tax=Streptomyces syringium TaxID=76729 RepID=A0ABS4YDP3_9ACTN|nr:alpha/beta fold hydrolase [Streptomyces syringium]MBP2406003.1 pimeloyl-ACP methyl ester carboxylesterase [Streptomyces syringium]